MAGDAIYAKVKGLDQLKRALAEAAKDIRTKALRAALREAGKVIMTAARARAPILRTAARHRQPGTIQRNIVVRASKFARRAKNEGVYISVRPLRGKRQRKLGRAGADNPNDPFYWVFQEFGWRPRGPRKGRMDTPGRPVPGRRFMTTAATSAGPNALQVFIARVIPSIEKLNAKAEK